MARGTYTPQAQRVPVTGLRLGRIVGCVVLLVAVVGGGAYWLLTTHPRPAVAAVDQAAWPSWLKQQLAYPAPEAKPAVATPPPPPDTTADDVARLQAMVDTHQRAIEDLRRRPQTPPVVQVPPKAAPPPPKPPAPMLFVHHDLKDTPPVPAPKVGTYTVMPGSYVPCQVETAMNSDTGDTSFVAAVTSTVYDTATGRYALIPQSSKIVGEAQGSQLVYGNELLRTVSLSVSRRQDTAPIDLGTAPVTDQQGVGGLASSVDQHFWRLVGAVFIGGALRGGTAAVTTAVASAGPAGAIGGGIAQSGQQAITQRTGPALSTRPTIKVHAGQLCTVIVTKPLTLTEAR